LVEWPLGRSRQHGCGLLLCRLVGHWHFGQMRQCL